jgi:hypothetical protein
MPVSILCAGSSGKSGAHLLISYSHFIRRLVHRAIVRLMGDISLTISLNRGRPQSVGLKANRIPKLRKPFAKSGQRAGLKGQELNLLIRTASSDFFDRLGSGVHDALYLIQAFLSFRRGPGTKSPIVLKE